MATAFQPQSFADVLLLVKSGGPSGSGWSIIPGGHHLGRRRKHGKGWEYWYPDKKMARHEAKRHTAEAAEHKRRAGLTPEQLKKEHGASGAAWDWAASSKAHVQHAKGAATFAETKTAKVKLPERTADTMSDAIAISSPSGRMSKRAKDAATEKLRVKLFGEKGLTTPQQEQPSEAEALRRNAKQLRELAARGMKTRAYTKKADELDEQANALDAASKRPKAKPAAPQKHPAHNTLRQLHALSDTMKVRSPKSEEFVSGLYERVRATPGYALSDKQQTWLSDLAGKWLKKTKKAETFASLFKANPPPGYSLAPGSRKGAYRKKVGNHWEYWDAESGHTGTGKKAPPKGGTTDGESGEAVEWRKEYGHLKLSKYPPPGIPKNKVTVDISGDVHSHAVLIWRDKSGARQGAYTKQFEARNAAKKWARIRALLPKFDAAVVKLHAGFSDTARPDKRRDLAAILFIIAKTGLRPGHRDESAHGTFGVASLKPEHVKVSGDTVSFDFTGKAKKRNVAEIKDAALAKYVKIRLGSGDNAVWRVSADSLPTMMTEVGLDKFKPKDFRTLVATRTAAEMLAEEQPPTPMPENEAKAKRTVLQRVNAVSKKVGERLNNTPAMARKRYIDPSVIEAWTEQAGGKHLVKAAVTAKSILDAALAKPKPGKGDARLLPEHEQDEPPELEAYPLPKWLRSAGKAAKVPFRALLERV